MKIFFKWKQTSYFCWNSKSYIWNYKSECYQTQDDCSVLFCDNAQSSQEMTEHKVSQILDYFLHQHLHLHWWKKLNFPHFFLYGQFNCSRISEKVKRIENSSCGICIVLCPLTIRWNGNIKFMLCLWFFTLWPSISNVYAIK